MADYDLEAELDRRSLEQRKRVKAELRRCGRQDLADELDAKMRDIDLGIDGARSTWAALSPTQRRVLRWMGDGYALHREKWSRTVYGARHETEDAIADMCRLPTVRNLCLRELCHPDGDTFDPEKKIVITERGRFVLKHGPVNL